MESLSHAFEMAEAPVEMTSSFDKENRTSVQGVGGLGLSQAFDVFAQMKEMFFCPIITDVQEKDPCQEASSIVDILQILDFLCRQTDVLVVAAKTQAVVNIKKGQFLPPWDMKNVLEKLSSNGKKDILLTERGVSFGYNTWICDPRSFPIMVHETTLPVIIDATHSVQNPGGAGSFSSGDRRMAPILARSALANGVAEIFAEVHQDPDHAPSDGPNMLYIRGLKDIVQSWLAIDVIAKNILFIFRGVLGRIIIMCFKKGRICLQLSTCMAEKFLIHGGFPRFKWKLF